MRNPNNGIGGHHSPIARTEDWLTPPSIIEALGGADSFDLDPCASEGQPWRTAKACYFQADNGLLRPWVRRVWLNPPYTANVIGSWLRRLADHGEGTALIFARTETEAFFRNVWDRAHALLFLEGRINFHYGADAVRAALENLKPGQRPPKIGDRCAANSGAPSVLCAYGRKDADILAACDIDGQFVPLIVERAWLVQLPKQMPEQTWSAALVEWFAQNPGPVKLSDLYRAFADHPKAKGNRNVDAKIRQQLQRGPFKRTDRGQWEMAL